MGLNIAIRFNCDDGNIDFYEEEITDLAIMRNQKIDLFKEFPAYYGGAEIGIYYGMNYMGKSYKSLSLTIKPVFLNTMTKIESLFDNIDAYFQPKTMICYYQYRMDTLAGLTNKNQMRVQMKRDDMQWIYHNGKIKAQPIKLDFIETEYTGIGVLSKGIVKS
ncbi:hypothetical protein [Neomegalonema sp.]|uniref:hypothetical protein n=1 Tax=Neomegalonema sp. TaxID=2039713 RepID=UPI002602EDDF|nr:hypothetical protein [Neomegalonema sp.]MDD2869689.1 hypothetical protein [Neomegalonema sp.]